VTERTRNRKYIAILASVSASILIAGALLRPAPDAATSAARPPSETDLLRLTRLSQRRSLDSMADYFGYVADGAARSLAFVPESHGTGVAWSARVFVTAPIGPASRDVTTVIAEGASYRAQAEIRGPQLPLAALGMPDTLTLAPLPRAETPPVAGDWLIAVWQTATGRAFAPGTFLAVEPATCERRPVRETLTSLTLTGAMSGAALVDTDGQLLAIVLPCDGRLAAVPPEDVDAMLEAGRSLEGRLLAAWGFRADPLTLDEAAFFKVADGVIVREVWNGFPADRSGLRPGDILRAIGEQPVDTLESLRALADADTAVLTVARGRRSAAVPLARGEAAPPVSADAAPPLGFIWAPLEPGYPIESVVGGSAAAQAGIRRGDVLMRIDHAEPRNMAHVRRLLATGRTAAAFVELQRGERRWGVLLR
jgi:S1-C subfamily serine protease